MILRCTAKAGPLFGGRPVPPRPPDDDDWYADVLWLERRTCVLALHAGTGFAVFVPRVRRADVRPPGPWLTRAIGAQLAAEELPPTALAHEFGDVELAKIADRAVLGALSGLGELITSKVHRTGLARCEPVALARLLNTTPLDRSDPRVTAHQRLATR